MTTKTLGYYFKLPYVIELIPDEDGYWFASIPLLKGCMTQGESREEALVMLDEAKELCRGCLIKFANSIVYARSTHLANNTIKPQSQQVCYGS
jgi:predicted RNase H-like HicB family nuclease